MNSEANKTSDITFPFNLEIKFPFDKTGMIQKICLNGPITTLIGPNGSKKSQLLRGIKRYFDNENIISGKATRFLSASRMGMSNFGRTDSHGTGLNVFNLGDREYTKRRKSIETVDGDFHTLSERPDILIKVRERLLKFFKRDILVDWNGGKLQVFFQNYLDNTSYSTSREASGLMLLVGLLTSLYDDEIGVLIIDEPEVSLHPQLQKFILKEIKKVSGIPNNDTNEKIIIIATHSPEFIDLNSILDLTNLIFCQPENKNTRQININNEVLKSKNLSELIVRLGQDHKSALFSNMPLLVEGPSDRIILNGLSNKLDVSVEASGSQILPIIGKGEFPSVIKLLRLVGKTPVVLADADAFIEDNKVVREFLENESADRQASALGHESAMDFEKKVRSGFSKLTVSSEIYLKTIFSCFNDGSVKFSKLNVFKALFQCTSELDLSNDWMSMRQQLVSILDFLESLGCFILRKGTIEDYYTTSESHQIGKPQIAVYEVAKFDQMNKDEIEKQYDDIIRCIKFVSKSPNINENEIIKDYALAIVSIAVEHLKLDKNAKQIKSAIKITQSDNVELFTFEKIGNKLKIDLNSKILQAKNFPLIVDKDTNVGDYLKILDE